VRQRSPLDDAAVRRDLCGVGWPGRNHPRPGRQSAEGAAGPGGSRPFSSAWP